MTWLGMAARAVASASASASATSGSSSTGSDLLGGTDLIRLLVLAFGGALVVGNVLALVRPPSRQSAAARRDGQLDRPPLSRSVVMISIGAIAVIWALASLAS